MSTDEAKYRDENDRYREALEDIASHMASCPYDRAGCALHMRDTARVALGLPIATAATLGG